MDFLYTKLGPYEVWQWLLIVGAGVGLAVVVNRVRGGSNDEGPIVATKLGDLTQNPYAGMMATGGPGTVYTAPDGSAGLALTAKAKPTTNREWIGAASEALAGLGLYGAAAVDSALRKYLQGNTLDQTDYAIVNAALQAVGPPPEGAPPIKRTTQDVPSSDPTKLLIGTFHTGPADLDGQAVRIGGTSDDPNVARLSVYSSPGGNPDLIDTLADLRTIERRRGRPTDDPDTARAVLRGSFGTVAQSFRPTLERIAAR